MPKTSKGETLLTYQELADKTGYAYSTVRKKMSRGEWDLTVVRLEDDGPPRVRESEVDAWITKRAEQTEAASN